MAWQQHLRGDPLPWLLEPDAPGAHFLALRYLLDRPPDELLAIHEALDMLGREDPQAAELVKLRYFLGMSIPEAATALGTSTRSVDRLWAFARCWLQSALEDNPRKWRADRHSRRPPSPPS